MIIDVDYLFECVLQQAKAGIGSKARRDRDTSRIEEREGESNDGSSCIRRVGSRQDVSNYLTYRN